MEIPETKRFISKGFELGTTLSQRNRSINQSTIYFNMLRQGAKKPVQNMNMGRSYNFGLPPSDIFCY